MDFFFPSPPSSPIQHAADQIKVLCGSCDRALSSDWFCSDCHKKCATCNRFLSSQEYCSRCWSYDTLHNLYVRKPYQPHPFTMPTDSCYQEMPKETTATTPVSNRSPSPFY
ncbi:uncharacterized protein BYT42DRAFT_609850 [Radiomyces spectabilis]|uniref:uncharacterized protein n=1 Tax=Radiomyces spectabilis TaxID=64574 RepID=UPI00221E4B94|nr:uncharacterized protein BYT42DRAFT_609850 [Radiomyces spectabilis]KAI8394103.1 hypothetical protein BYT42DRAFT_609850 [Radiomyces spectabilis]